jgi:hypothetical protein
MNTLSRLLVLLVFASACASAQPRQHTAAWRAATTQELGSLLPARAPVVHERIETETSSNTGITDDHGHFIAATVLITAGYAAHGKYSHFLMTQVPLTLDDRLTLAPGSYLVGWERGADGLDVHVYRADNGEAVGSVGARPSATHLTVVSVRIWPPRERSVLQIGRFLIPYEIR